MRDALRHLRKLYSQTPADEFGPQALKTLRQYLIEEGYARTHINRQIGRVKRVFKWAVSEELIPPSIHHGLQTVTGLRYSRTEARESNPIRPVEDRWIEATLPYVSPQIQAMIQIQRLTGMRPGEVIKMRPADILREEEIWIYEPSDHKNRW
jgi:integrase